jgi:aspartate kinase
VYLFQVGQEASREVETQAALLAPLGEIRRVPAQLTEGCTMVSLVGRDYMQQSGLFLKVLSTLSQNQVTVLQTSDSEFSLSVLVPESEANRAVRLLHDKFISSEVR